MHLNAVALQVLHQELLSVSVWRAFHLQEPPGFSWPGKEPQIRVETMVTSHVTSLLACMLPPPQPRSCADTLVKMWRTFGPSWTVQDTLSSATDRWPLLDSQRPLSRWYLQGRRGGRRTTSGPGSPGWDSSSGQDPAVPPPVRLELKKTKRGPGEFALPGIVLDKSAVSCVMCWISGSVHCWFVNQWTVKPGRSRRTTGGLM